MKYELWWKPSLTVTSCTSCTSWHTHLVAHSNHNSVAIRLMYFQYACSHLHPMRSDTSSPIAITVPSLCPEIGLFPIVLCTGTQTFVPKASSEPSDTSRSGCTLTIPKGTITQTRTLTCEQHSVHGALPDDGQINTLLHTRRCIAFRWGAQSTTPGITFNSIVLFVM